MEVVAISKIRIDEAGRLRVLPASNPNEIFQFIYRAAMEVDWDGDERSFCTPVPREWSYADWYFQVLSAVKSEMGVLLRIEGTTLWNDVPPTVEREIRRRMQVQASGSDRD
jgi:hypothetical protein